jgi:hypothetical protein
MVRARATSRTYHSNPMPSHGPTREQFYAHWQAFPPYSHPQWRAYVIASNDPGKGLGAVQFGRWLARKHPARFAQDFAQWKATLQPALST